MILRHGPATVSIVAALLVAASPAAAQIRMVDVTDETGISFRHTDGSSGKRYIMETVTAGVALLDYDGDEDLDIYFVNGAPLPGATVDAAPTNELYRNDGDWTFTNVTEQAGVGDTGYGLGVAAADYNNDGTTDLYVSNYGANVLYCNNGDGTFSQPPAAANLANGERMGAGAAFLDIDADGNLDLYVANYVQFSQERYKPHFHKGVPAYESPLRYPPEADFLYRSTGDGRFEDFSVESGIAQHRGAGMGVIAADYDDDGDTDIFICNDLSNNFLFQNDGAGRFEEVALFAGTAFDLNGDAQGSMGVDAADFDNDGLLDFHMTTFAGELATLYRNLGGGLFADDTRRSGASGGVLAHVSWGNGFADFDNDGDQDLFIACGHLDDNIELRDASTSYAVPNVLLRNEGRGEFVDISSEAGPGMAASYSSRGAALGDLDGDGDIDVVVANARTMPTILRNDSPLPSRWLKIRLTGISANRQGVGAQIRVKSGELVQTRQVHSGRGYQSHFGLPLHFGLGNHDNVDLVEIRWPGGKTVQRESVSLNQIERFLEPD